MLVAKVVADKQYWILQEEDQKVAISRMQRKPSQGEHSQQV